MRLYVNIDHVATLREARKTDEPDPARAAEACERAGADGITAHLREDRRHIQDADIRALQSTAHGRQPRARRDPGDRAVRMPRESVPGHAGSGAAGARSRPRAASALRPGDRRVAAPRSPGSRAPASASACSSTPISAVIDRATDLGVPAIELHTGRYAQTWRKSRTALRQLQRAATHAAQRGLAVHAGHGLTYENVQPVAAIPEIEELNIGHTIVSNAVYWGLEEAVRRMRNLVDEAAGTQRPAISSQRKPPT